MTWYPHITVAAVVKRQNTFLVVQERNEDGDLVVNQPAGHLEENESIYDAVVRETLEETGWRVEPKAVLNFNLYKAPSNQTTYFRCNVFAEIVEQAADGPLDPDIEQAIWLTEQEIHNHKLRSPMVTKAIDEFNQKVFYPLDIIQSFLNPNELV